MKKILIIKCGDTYESVKDIHGDFDEMIIKRSNLPRNIFKIFNVHQGEQLRHPGEYIAAFITGSHSDTNEKTRWVKQLKDWIITARYSNVPVLGICFGHQVIAEALGGKVEMNRNGMALGTDIIKLTPTGNEDPLFKNIDNNLTSYKSHSYYVSMTPPGAVILAKNDSGITEAFRLDKIYGTQFHSEFNNDIAKEYYRYNKNEEPPAKFGVKMKQEFKNEMIIPNFIDLSLKF
ncbi:MAG: gamma-glutamyl-gamma-aminobutyrate hydrolase family protein [Prolixibacteraceae bacterium]|jgi:GMP synthase (glutamine-hydrolysing)|nr:gamma-glutamyl-gamma-aminobutyrate hydrolase family protein [Prolixibacteraceae bacterium]